MVGQSKKLSEDLCKLLAKIQMELVTEGFLNISMLQLSTDGAMIWQWKEDNFTINWPD